jgi:hypothetical protein
VLGQRVGVFVVQFRVQIKTTGMTQLVKEITSFNKYSSKEELDNVVVSEISEKVTSGQGHKDWVAPDFLCTMVFSDNRYYKMSDLEAMDENPLLF